MKIYGTDYVVVQFGGWEPISAEQTASGYEVAWKLAGFEQYSVYDIDMCLDYIPVLFLANGFVSGADPALQSLEGSFHQDLNGDGIILLSGSGSIIRSEERRVGNESNF